MQTKIMFSTQLDVTIEEVRSISGYNSQVCQSGGADNLDPEHLKLEVILSTIGCYESFLVSFG
jgi:hypothetical protein